MPGYIPDDIVQRIKTESDIAAIISEFVSLKNSGKDFKGLCPFHQEKTPSFYVIPSKGFYHCFGCGAGGNVVNFVMDHEKLEYPDALRFLAEKAGITIPETHAPKSDYEMLYEALALAGSYYIQSFKNPDIGAAAYNYMSSRGISDATARQFAIGYASDGWDNLLKLAASKSISAPALEKAGLAIKKDDRYYDRFRNRLMIPIRSLSGRIVGFGGRVLPGDDSPKYINSPETDVYKKGKLLFGLDIAKDEIRAKDEAVVVEGYFDLIALYQYGIRNVVAVSGTGFTSDQAGLLSRFCSRVALLYDPDSAGVRAAFRACGVLYNSGIEPRLIRLPKGNDPDTFVREHGADALQKLIAESGDVIDFIRNGLEGKFSDQSLPRQEKIIRALAETADTVVDPIRRSLLIKRIAERFDLPLSALERQLGQAPGPAPRIENRKIISSGREKPEREFIGLLLSNPMFISEVEVSVNTSLFVDQDNAALYEMIQSRIKLGLPIGVPDLFDQIEDAELRHRLSQIALIDFGPAEPRDILNQHLREFKLIAIKRRNEELKSLISEAEKQKDRTRIDQLTREFQNLQSRGANE